MLAHTPLTIQLEQRRRSTLGKLLGFAEEAKTTLKELIYEGLQKQLEAPVSPNADRLDVLEYEAALDVAESLLQRFYKARDCEKARSYVAERLLPALLLTDPDAFSTEEIELLNAPIAIGSSVSEELQDLLVRINDRVSERLAQK